MEQLELDMALGDGASGDVLAAKFQGRPVAVKVFKAETSPDGHARDEIAVTCHVNHANLIKVNFDGVQSHRWDDMKFLAAAISLLGPVALSTVMAWTEAVILQLFCCSSIIHDIVKVHGCFAVYAVVQRIA